MSAPVQVNGSFTSVIQVTGEEVGCREGELFDSALLTGLDLLRSEKIPFPNGLTVSSPGEGLRVRPLCLADYDRGFLQLLGQLTTVGEISRDQWEDRFSEMKTGTGTYFVVGGGCGGGQGGGGSHTTAGKKVYPHMWTGW